MKKFILGILVVGSVSTFSNTTIDSLEQGYIDHLNAVNVVSPGSSYEQFQDEKMAIEESQLSKSEYAILRLEICQSVTPSCDVNIEFARKTGVSDQDITAVIELGTIKRNMSQEEKDRLLSEQQQLQQQQSWNY